MTTSFKILGYDDSVHECDCCGKSNLKMTVIVEVNGEIMHYGSVCSTRHTGMKSGQIKKAVEAEVERVVELARAEYRAHGIAKEYHMESERNRKAGLVGKPFYEAMTDVRERHNLVISDIAKKFNVNFNRICV